MNTALQNATDQAQADAIVQSGWASAGDLVVSKGSQTLYKVTGHGRIKYKVMNDEGLDFVIPFLSCVAPPAGAVFSGPEKSRIQVLKAERADAARAFSVGDTVEMADAKGAAQFPGTYVIVKKTSPTRFSLQQIGGHVKLTSPASMIKHV